MPEESSKDIPEMNLNNNYSSSNKTNLPSPTETQKNIDKTKKELNKLKLFITKKYPFVKAIGVFHRKLLR